MTFKVDLMNESRAEVLDITPNSILLGYSVLLCLASCVCLFCNGVHLHVLRKFDELTPGNLIVQQYYGIINIVSAACFALLTPVMTKDHWYLRETYCISCGVVLSFAPVASALLSGFLEVDRFCAVVTPYRYARLATRRNAHFSTLVTILVACVPVTASMAAKGTSVISETNIRICFLGFQDVFPYQRVGQVLIFSITTTTPLLVAIMYAWLLLVTYRQSRRILRQERAVRADAHLQNDQGFIERIQHIQKASRALTATFGGYILFWGPPTLRLYLIFTNVYVPFWFNMICFLCLLGSSVMNIVLLSIFKSKYRLGFNDSILKCIHLFKLSRRNRIGLQIDT